MNARSGIVFDIQRYSVQDGPGIRSTVFLKGCPLSCEWCSNPESQSLQPQLLYFQHLCQHCGACVERCPHQTLSIQESQLTWQRENCCACGLCVVACMHGARSLSGTRMSVADVCENVRQDWRIYMTSGGGITCGGGEALAQPDFLHDLLSAVHDELGFHTCLDTSGHAPWDILQGLLPVLDLILLDIKHMNSATHKSHTGVGNEHVLANARQLASRNIPVIIRLPLIPGFNDSASNIRALGGFMKEAGLPQLEIMPYHTLGLTKYAALGRAYNGPMNSKVAVEEVLQLLQDFPLQVHVH